MIYINNIKKYILLLIIINFFNLFFIANYSFSQNSYGRVVTGKRAIPLIEMPYNWNEIFFINYGKDEFNKFFVNPLIKLAKYNNINKYNEFQINYINIQKIKGNYGNITIKHIEFSTVSDTHKYLYYVFKFPHLFNNVYYKLNVVYDVVYQDRRDFDTFANLIDLDDLQKAKIPLMKIPLPFELKGENLISSDITPEFFSTKYDTGMGLSQEFYYNNNIITINYYNIKNINISDVREYSELFPLINFLVDENVLIEIKGDYNNLFIEFPQAIKIRKEKLDN